MAFTPKPMPAAPTPATYNPETMPPKPGDPGTVANVPVTDRVSSTVV